MSPGEEDWLRAVDNLQDEYPSSLTELHVRGSISVMWETILRGLQSVNQLRVLGVDGAIINYSHVMNLIFDHGVLEELWVKEFRLGPEALRSS